MKLYFTTDPEENRMEKGRKDRVSFMEVMFIEKKIKRYLAFTSFAYRVGVCAAAALLLAMGVSVGSFFGETGLMCTAGFLTMAEILSDYWLFCGLQAKESHKMDFLRTSGVGMEAIRDALIMDLLRKFLTALGILGASYLLTGLQGGFLYMVLASYACSVLGTVFSRYGGSFFANVSAAQLSAVFVLASLLYMPRTGLSRYSPAYSLFFAALGIGGGIFTVAEGMQKVKGGYEDE